MLISTSSNLALVDMITCLNLFDLNTYLILAEILTTFSLHFLESFRHRKFILKLTDLYCREKQAYLINVGQLKASNLRVSSNLSETDRSALLTFA